MVLTLTQFDYRLPFEQIAQSPMEPRDHCRLLVVDQRTQTLTDKLFYDLEELLTDKDVLVLNDTKVFPARLFGENKGKPVEILLEKELSQTPESITFSALTKPGLKRDEVIHFPSGFLAVCIEISGYTRTLKFNLPREKFFQGMQVFGRTPIPPYIKGHQDDEPTLRQKYQTVYANHEGAVAAPTAGLHFTEDLLERLTTKGVQLEYVTLHVGLGTFLPVKTEDISQHEMHEERFELSEKTASRLNAARDTGKRIIAVGTTVIRVLESQVEGDFLKAGRGTTKIFIYPPYQFKFVDSLITNFHTPKSTLLMLVTALVGGVDFKSSLMGKAYHYALTHGYRFYSFGDAMWIK